MKNPRTHKKVRAFLVLALFGTLAMNSSWEIFQGEVYHANMASLGKDSSVLVLRKGSNDTEINKFKNKLSKQKFSYRTEEIEGDATFKFEGYDNDNVYVTLSTECKTCNKKLRDPIPIPREKINDLQTLTAALETAAQDHLAKLDGKASEDEDEAKVDTKKTKKEKKLARKKKREEKIEERYEEAVSDCRERKDDKLDLAQCYAEACTDKAEGYSEEKDQKRALKSCFRTHKVESKLLRAAAKGDSEDREEVREYITTLVDDLDSLEGANSIQKKLITAYGRTEAYELNRYDRGLEDINRDFLRAEQAPNLWASDYYLRRAHARRVSLDANFRMDSFNRRNQLQNTFYDFVDSGYLNRDDASDILQTSFVDPVADIFARLQDGSAVGLKNSLLDSSTVGSARMSRASLARGGRSSSGRYGRFNTGLTSRLTSHSRLSPRSSNNRGRVQQRGAVRGQARGRGRQRNTSFNGQGRYNSFGTTNNNYNRNRGYSPRRRQQQRPVSRGI